MGSGLAKRGLRGWKGPHPAVGWGPFCLSALGLGLPGSETSLGDGGGSERPPAPQPCDTHHHVPSLRRPRKGIWVLLPRPVLAQLPSLTVVTCSADQEMRPCLSFLKKDRFRGHGPSVATLPSVGQS